MNNKTESALSALTFCRINDGEFNDELLNCIKEILAESDSHNAGIFNATLWKWQYEKLPSGLQKIYICLDNGRIAGYYHVPVYEGLVKGVNKKFGVVQDVAVKKYLRGRSVFRQLSEFATSDLLSSGIDLLYTFPNEKSIHTFLKYNSYSLVQVYDSFLLPVKCAHLIKAKIRLAGIENLIGAFGDLFFRIKLTLKADEKITSSNNFNDDVLSLFDKFSSRFSIYRQRSKEYLNWRYVEKPFVNHLVLSLSNGKGILAAAVFKTDTIFNVNALVLLDFAYENEAHLAKLIHYVKKNNKEIFKQQAAIIFTSFCCHDFLKNKKYGFIKIPQRFNPRNLKMLVKNISVEELTVNNPKKWFATLGDWDVF